MPTLPIRYRLVRLALCLLAVSSHAVLAAPPVDVVSVDLAPLIDLAAESPTRFAVDVPHSVSTTTSGEWSRSGSTSTWTYSVQIPGAVSMSFHATAALLPSSATLMVTADGVDYTYTSKEARGGDLWSRIGRGDSLAFVLKVAEVDVGNLRLEIESFQAGYRSLGDGVSNHAHYDSLRKQALAATASCAQNWTCNVTTTNTGPGDATAALIINNTALCTGVLLNDVPNDGAPYMITARHCQNGNSDGGSPGAASSIVVYWNAISACGSLLGNVYDAGSTVQYGGAVTVVEQQDMWLVRLRDYPAVDAYYAGWDATGGSFVGGFTPHHASGTARQFVGWYGQAVYFTLPPSSLGVSYTSTFWGTVNGVGAGGPGSSGGGLFNDTGRLVGTLVRGLNAPDGTGLCPITPPPAPTQSDATGLSTAFSGVFSSTADPGSTTGATTLRTALDPGNTGKLVLDGTRRPIGVTLTTYAQSVSTGTQIGLDWSAHPATTSCTASGGETGDGWSGAIPSQASKAVTSFDGGDVVYTVTCTDGSQTGSASLRVHWTLSQPSIYFSGEYYPDYGVPWQLSWSSTVRPCTATGGGQGDGWGGALNPIGKAFVTETTVGQITYTMTCGSGARSTTAQVIANIQAPSVSLQADAATLRLGEVVNITIDRHGGPCTKAGGASGDGWSGTLPLNNSAPPPTAVTETTPGIYTFSITCGSGAHVASSQVTVTYRNDPPAVSVRLSKTTAFIDIDAIEASWDANLRPCQTTVTGPMGTSYPVDVAPLGSTTVGEGVIGQYTFAIACGSGTNTAHASAAMTFTGTPTLSLDAPSEAIAGTSFTIFFTTNVLPCTASGGTAGDFWSGQFSSQRSYSVNVVEASGGRQTYTLTCGTGSQIATSSVTVDVDAEAPLVTITPTPFQQITGQPVTLSWSSNRSPCQAYGGNGSDGWSGSGLGASGSITISEHTAGNYLFSMSCGSSYLRANNSTSVQFADVAAPTLTVSKAEVTLLDTVTLTWHSADGSACVATGSTEGWYGMQPASGTLTFKTNGATTLYFGLVCGASLPSVVTVKVNPLPEVTVTLTASVPVVTVGQPFVLTWTIANADSCTAYGGSAGDGWMASTFTQSGSQTLRPNTGGQIVYTLACSRSSTGDTASASATIDVPLSTPTIGSGGSSGGSGGGGGGSIGPLDLAFFSALGLLSWRQRRRDRVLHRS